MMLYHGKAATADPMQCSSLFIDRIGIHVNRHNLDVKFLHL